VLGKEHPDTLASVNNLALVLRNQGKTAEASSCIDERPKGGRRCSEKTIQTRS
jgi:hypothetical protein